MRKVHRFTLLLLPLALFATFGVLSLLANAWLASSGGKIMLERELSSSLGYTVWLTGDFSISLLPRIAIEGSGFELYAPQARRLLIRAEHYSAAIELLPFLRREVQVDSITLRGGFFDLGILMSRESGPDNSGRTALSIPQLDSLGIEEFSLVFSDPKNIVALKKVELEGFEIGREARLSIEASWISDNIEMAELALQAGLKAEPAFESIKLAVNQLRVHFGETAVSGLSGNLLWNKVSAYLSGELSWISGAASAHSTIQINLGEIVNGKLTASYTRSLESPPAQAQAGFIVHQEQLNFPEVNFQWNEQVIAGSGCYWLTEPAGMYLVLASPELDLDRIKAYLSADSSGDVELPFNLALDLHVDSARYLGARARNVDVKIGEARACAVATVPGPEK